MGARYRLHASAVPGRPDLSNRRAKVAVFVDGCFWHGCPKHYKAPKTRRAFWNGKIRRNMERRNEVLDEYPSGWQVVQVFECDLKSGPEAWARRVATAMRRRP